MNHRHVRVVTIHLACAAIVCLATACRQPSGWKLREAPEDWHFSGFHEPLDLSGVARANDRHALVVADESHSLQPGALDPDKRILRAGEPIPLPAAAPIDDGKKSPEADLEGVAWNPADSCYYVVGSHGLGKKKGDYQASRHAVFRLPFDAATGRIDVSRIQRASLTRVFEEIPGIRPFVHRPLQSNGLNVEGLAARDGRLWVGLRGPNLDGNGVVIEIDPVELFRGGTKSVVHEIPLGRGRGIRELVAIADGFVILTGNASAEATKKIPETEAPGPDRRFVLHHWVPGHREAAVIGRLPETDGKAEGLLLLAEKPASVRILVLFDGIPGGGPRAFVLERPAAPGI